MKYENLMLQALFSVCLLVCVLTLAAMVTAHPGAPVVSTNHDPAPAVAAR